MRRLRLLVAVLVTSNLLAGLFSIYILRKQDREYSVLIDESVPVMNEVRMADTTAAKLYEAVIAGLLTPDPVKCANAVKQARHYLVRGKMHRDRALSAGFLQRDPTLVVEFRNAGEAYEEAVTRLLPRITPENTADRERDHIEQLQAIYDKYASAIRRVSWLVQKEAKAASGDYSLSTNRHSIIVLGLASWPMLVLIAILAFTLAFVLVMAFIFRTASPGDGP